MAAYAKGAVWDCLLCIVTATALCYTVCSGFYATQVFQNPAGIAIMAGGCALLVVALFLVSFNTRTALVGSPLLALAVVGALFACHAAGGGTAPLDDIAGNLVYLPLVITLSALLVFLLSRRKTTAVVLVVIGSLACAAIEYLYWYGHAVPFAVFLAGSIVLLVYRTYQRSLLNSESESLAFGSVTAAGAVLAVVSVACGIGLFAALIAPLDPPNVMVKLITEHYRVDTVEMRGIGSIADEPDPTLISNVMSNIKIVSKLADEQLENRQNEDETSQGADESDVMGLGDEGVDETPEGSGAASLGLFDRPWIALVIIGLILLAIVAAVLVKKALRARRYKRLTSGGRDAAVEALYLFFLGRFKRLKIPQPDALTLEEYVRDRAPVFEEFERSAEGPQFAALTGTYIRRAYGGESMSEEDFSDFEGYYRVFYKRARRYVGRLKYCFRFFAL